MSTTQKRLVALVLCVSAMGWSMATDSLPTRRTGMLRLLARLGLRAISYQQPAEGQAECMVLHQHSAVDVDGSRIINHGDWW